jgi:glutamyl/glutaminyl-tRNA synthetase
MSMLRTRIAPTPSGYLHEGNVFSFVLTWLLARKQDGALLLRIDDLDSARVKDAYIEDIFKVLDFIGLQPDEGPAGVKEFLEKYSQHHRLHLYRDQLTYLNENKYLYACNCTRSQMSRDSEHNVYYRHCRDKNIELHDGQFALRIKTESDSRISFLDECPCKNRSLELGKRMGDFVVGRKDGLPAYQLASVVDDHYFGINYIVRGEDLLLSSAAQLFLAEKLLMKDFGMMRWYHHPLLVGANGEKLSKSAGAGAVSMMVEKGLTKRDLLSSVGKKLDLPGKSYNNLHELLNDFLQNR